MSATSLAAAERYVEVGQPERALEVLADLDSDTAVSPRAQVLRAFALYGAERFREAADVARDGLEDDPDSVELLFALSLAREQLGDLGEAERTVLAALALVPEDVQLLCQYASVLMRGGQLEKAERLLDEAAAREPESPDVLQERLSLAYLRADDRQVRALTQQLLALDPESVQGHRMLGVLAFNRGDAAEAAERFAEGVRHDPSNERWADDAREARSMTSFLYWPARLIGRFGVAQTWIAAIVIIYGLRSAGFGTAASVAGFTWLGICIWSWILAAKDRN